MAIEGPPIPSIVAMLLCDHVITEAGSNKKTLIGVFDRWQLLKFPERLGTFWIYARLTDAEGKYVFKLRFVYLDEDKFLMEAKTEEITAADRLASCELALPVPLMPVEKPGRYEIQLLANDVYIGRTTMSVVRRSGG